MLAVVCRTDCLIASRRVEVKSSVSVPARCQLSYHVFTALIICYRYSGAGVFSNMISPAWMTSSAARSAQTPHVGRAAKTGLPKILNVRGGLSAVGIELELLQLAEVYDLDPHMVQLEETRLAPMQDLHLTAKLTEPKLPDCVARDSQRSVLGEATENQR